MKEIIKLGLVLFLVCAIAAMALGMTNEVTKGQIADNAVIAAREARQAVYPTADDFILIASSSAESYEAHPSADAFLKENTVVREVYKAMTSGEHVGFVIKTAPNGYGGEVGVTVGLSLDGSIQGVQVDTPNETPGLGAKAKTPDFYSQYEGLTVTSPIEVLKLEVTDENAIQSISGATITSQAVTDGVNYGMAVIETFK
ncbi:RnfABCDGE type electron transport complex subunit G [Acidaminobacter sp. JC074]|uniref:RnfABCDGE type electron transport complex subunit G n=1 Tax=Acidaminobacter sp. JC074 TaxID=2530199 RepID=UPI001F0FE83A|nr:RnfABCDGE type electron transport complex subunit G [Acidaminobacter sp. JC074]MCH4886643.1 RnfABCDGE type electron transport complex subunit G [Acidaminobacter sp. JC074]